MDSQQSKMTKSELDLENRALFEELQHRLKQIDALREALREALSAMDAIKEIIEDVDHRAMAADGPVTPTRQEMTDREMRNIYEAAIFGSRVARALL